MPMRSVLKHNGVNSIYAQGHPPVALMNNPRDDLFNPPLGAPGEDNLQVMVKIIVSGTIPGMVASSAHEKVDAALAIAISKQLIDAGILEDASPDTLTEQLDRANRSTVATLLNFLRQRQSLPPHQVQHAATSYGLHDHSDVYMVLYEKMAEKQMALEGGTWYIDVQDENQPGFRIIMTFYPGPLPTPVTRALDMAPRLSLARPINTTYEEASAAGGTLRDRVVAASNKMVEKASLYAMDKGIAIDLDATNPFRCFDAKGNTHILGEVPAELLPFVTFTRKSTNDQLLPLSAAIPSNNAGAPVATLQFQELTFAPANSTSQALLVAASRPLFFPSCYPPEAASPPSLRIGNQPRDSHKASTILPSASGLCQSNQVLSGAEPVRQPAHSPNFQHPVAHMALLAAMGNNADPELLATEIADALRSDSLPRTGDRNHAMRRALDTALARAWYRLATMDVEDVAMGPAAPALVEAVEGDDD